MAEKSYQVERDNRTNLPPNNACDVYGKLRCSVWHYKNETGSNKSNVIVAQLSPGRYRIFPKLSNLNGKRCAVAEHTALSVAREVVPQTLIQDSGSENGLLVTSSEVVNILCLDEFGPGPGYKGYIVYSVE